ncbi:MAG: MATE family efflux transporter [Kordiimonas sp.]
MSDQADNAFLTQPVPHLFMKTAVPIVVIMLVNGLYNVVDAWFLGEFVGPDALTAVTLMFPVQMMVFALSSIVSTGLSSMLARRLGAADKTGIYSCFTVAHILGVVISGVVLTVFLISGETMVQSLADGVEDIAAMGYAYIVILVFASPIMFTLSIHLDVLRAEGALKVMTMVTLSSTVLNIAFNYIFIVILEMGVVGSAYGTVVAQTLSLLFILLHYRFHSYGLKLGRFPWAVIKGDTQEMIALGLPASLNFLGVSLFTVITVYGLQAWSVDDYEATIGAFGIITRLTTFAYLPLMGITMAFQTVVGHNFGAGDLKRTNHILKYAMKTAFIYCALVEIAFILTASEIGALFVDSDTMIEETGRILPYMMVAFISFGPTMVVAQFFQAIGDAKKAALFNLSRTYMFLIPFMLGLPFLFGEIGLWYARPAAEVGVLCLMAVVLLRSARKSGARFGLFYNSP